MIPQGHGLASGNRESSEDAQLAPGRGSSPRTGEQTAASSPRSARVLSLPLDNGRRNRGRVRQTSEECQREPWGGFPEREEPHPAGYAPLDADTGNDTSPADLASPGIPITDLVIGHNGYTTELNTDMCRPDQAPCHEGS